MIAFKGGYSVEIWDGLSAVSVLREQIQAVSKYPRARINTTAKKYSFEYLVTYDKLQTHARAHIARRRRISLTEGKYRTRSVYRCTEGAIFQGQSIRVRGYRQQQKYICLSIWLLVISRKLMSAHISRAEGAYRSPKVNIAPKGHIAHQR